MAGMIKKTILVLLLFLVLFTAYALAQDERLEATLEMSRVSTGNPVYLNVTFYGGQDITRPDMPKMDGLQIKYVGPATQMTVVNGKVSRSITHTYLLLPLKEGSYKLGPFFAEYRGETYSAAPVTLSVGTSVGGVATGPAVSPPSTYKPAPSPQFEAAKKPYTGDQVLLRIEVPKHRVYINEIVPLTMKLYVYNMGLRDIEYPVFEHEGFSAGAWEEPIKREEIHKDMRYNVLVFKRDLFGIKEGSYALGPATLTCKVVVKKQPRRRSSFFRRSGFDDDAFFSDIFRRHETYPLELESNPVEMTILPFPEEDKPVDFKGAVGDFRLEMHIEPRKVKVGDPITVRMIIAGTGNMDTVTAPEIKAGEDFKVYEPQVTKKDNRKIYEQILIPKTEKIKEIPAISFSFFNPKTEKYETLKKKPVSIKVLEQPESERGVKVVSLGGAREMIYPPEEFGEDILHIKENIGYLQRRGDLLYRNPLFWGGQVVPLGVLLTLFFVHRKEERLRTDKRYARTLKAPRSARKGIKKSRSYLRKKDTIRFYDTVFKTLQEYLGNKFNIPGGSVTAEIIEDRLRPAGCEENVLEMIREVFAGCDMARYASSVPGGKEAEEVLAKVRKVIDYLEKTKL